MHAVRGTIGYTPTAPTADEKLASRDRWFGAKRPPIEAEVGSIERHEAIVATGKRPGLASYQKAQAFLDQAVAELASPQPQGVPTQGINGYPCYGISD